MGRARGLAAGGAVRGVRSRSWRGRRLPERPWLLPRGALVGEELRGHDVVLFLWVQFFLDRLRAITVGEALWG